MKLLLATLCSLALAAGDTKPDATKPVKGEHVSITARCDPPIVLPGGWVDVVIAYEIEPGWHATSPTSKGGQRVGLDLKLPEGFALSGRKRATAGKLVHDTSFGDVEQIAGRGEIRQRVRLPQRDEKGTRSLEGSTTWVVCDFERCLPPQQLSFRTAFDVDAAEGQRGPQLLDELQLTPDETTRLESTGHFIRVWADSEVARPGEEVFVVIDAVSGTKGALDNLSNLAYAQASGFRFLPGYRAKRKPIPLAGGSSATCVSEILPLRVDEDVGVNELRIPLAVSMGGMHDFLLKLAIER